MTSGCCTMGGSNCYLRDRRERKIVIKNGMEEYCSNFVLDKLWLDFRTVATSKPLFDLTCLVT